MRLVGHVDLRVEAREAKGTANGESQRGKPTQPRLGRQRPEKNDDCRRRSETERIGEAVELRPETRLRLQRPGDPAIHAVENPGNDHRDDGRPPVRVDSEANAGEARA